jgi:hypothetical protein
LQEFEKNSKIKRKLNSEKRPTGRKKCTQNMYAELFNGILSHQRQRTAFSKNVSLNNKEKLKN